MKALAICSEKDGKLFPQFDAVKHDCIAEFESYCYKRDVTWGVLIDDETGGVLASYSKTSGLETATAETNVFYDALLSQIKTAQEITDNHGIIGQVGSHAWKVQINRRLSVKVPLANVDA